MAGPGDVVSESLEASRTKEGVLATDARQISRAAGMLVEAIHHGRAVHLLGEASFAHLTAYLADLCFRRDRSRVLPVRALPAGGDDDLAAARAVEGFVGAGDVVVVLALDAGARLEAALLRVRARGATSVGLLGQAATASASRCDAAVVVPSARPLVVAEVLLAVGHVLLGLVVEGLARADRGTSSGRGGTGRLTPGAPHGSSHPAAVAPEPAARTAEASRVTAGSALVEESPAVSRSSITDLGVIDMDTLDSAEEEAVATEEAALLAEAVDHMAPPTEPSGRTSSRGGEAGPPRRRVSLPGSLRFRCGACDEPITVEERYAGRRGQCPHCLAEFTIPSPVADLTATQRAPAVRAADVARHADAARARGAAAAAPAPAAVDGPSLRAAEAPPAKQPLRGAEAAAPTPTAPTPAGHHRPPPGAAPEPARGESRQRADATPRPARLPSAASNPTVAPAPPAGAQARGTPATTPPRPATPAKGVPAAPPPRPAAAPAPSPTPSKGTPAAAASKAQARPPAPSLESSRAQKRQERRRAIRVAVKDALARFARDTFPGEAYQEPLTIEDLSLTGMRCLGRNKDLKSGDALCFALDFPAFPEPVLVKGEVRRLARQKDGVSTSVGVRFSSFAADGEARVRRLLENVQLRGIRRR